MDDGLSIEKNVPNAVMGKANLKSAIDADSFSTNIMKSGKGK